MYFSIIEGKAISLLEVAPAEIIELRRQDGHIRSVPVYWAKGEGVWPLPAEYCYVAARIDPITLKLT